MGHRALIRDFVRQQGGTRPRLEVDRWPEDENRNTPEIDAVAGPFAIEHTSVDTVPNQRRDNAWFKEAVGDLEREINDRGSSSPYRVHVTLPWGATRKGRDWNAIQDALRNFLADGAPTLPEGRPEVRGVPGIPFSFAVSKSRGPRPGVFFLRAEPEDDTLPGRMKDAFDHASKLARYRAPGTTTILLLESSDIALMNDERMMEPIEQAFPDSLPDWVDEVWYADTSIPGPARFRHLTPELHASRER
jgi:hypothetical protein